MILSQTHPIKKLVVLIFFYRLLNLKGYRFNALKRFDTFLARDIKVEYHTIMIVNIMDGYYLFILIIFLLFSSASDPIPQLSYFISCFRWLRGFYIWHAFVVFWLVLVVCGLVLVVFWLVLVVCGLWLWIKLLQSF